MAVQHEPDQPDDRRPNARDPQRGRELGGQIRAGRRELDDDRRDDGDDPRGDQRGLERAAIEERERERDRHDRQRPPGPGRAAGSAPRRGPPTSTETTSRITARRVRPSSAAVERGCSAPASATMIAAPAAEATSPVWSTIPTPASAKTSETIASATASRASSRVSFVDSAISAAARWSSAHVDGAARSGTTTGSGRADKVGLGTPVRHHGAVWDAKRRWASWTVSLPRWSGVCRAQRGRPSRRVSTDFAMRRCRVSSVLAP